MKRLFHSFRTGSEEHEIIGCFYLSGTFHAREVVVDIAPRVLSSLGISYDNLSFFHELGVP
jgi:hypothetical protein